MWGSDEICENNKFGERPIQYAVCYLGLFASDRCVMNDSLGCKRWGTCESMGTERVTNSQCLQSRDRTCRLRPDGDNIQKRTRPLAKGSADKSPDLKMEGSHAARYGHVLALEAAPEEEGEKNNRGKLPLIYYVFLPFSPNILYISFQALTAPLFRLAFHPFLPSCPLPVFLSLSHPTAPVALVPNDSPTRCHTTRRLQPWRRLTRSFC
jgi:hypothetical protein